MTSPMLAPRVLTPVDSEFEAHTVEKSSDGAERPRASKPLPVKTMKNIFFILFCALLMGGEAHAVDLDKLRQAVPLPRMASKFEFLVVNETNAPQDETQTRDQIAALKAAPVTAGRLLQLSRLYSQIRDEARAKEANARALPLLRRALTAHPADAALMVQLGQALRDATQLDEAGTVLRRAVQVAPRIANAWVSLGEVLSANAIMVVLPVGDGFEFRSGTIPSVDGLSAKLLDSRPSPKAIARAEALLDEASASYERAVQTAPSDPNVYGERIASRSRAAFLENLLQSLRANKAATLRRAVGDGAQEMMRATLFSPGTANDLQTIARLKPNDVSANGAATFSTLLVFATRNHREIPLKGGLQSLPALVAAQVRPAMGRLEEMAARRGKDQAKALEALGELRYILGDPSVTDTLKQAVALDPTRVQGWELMALILSEGERYGELATLIEARLQRDNTARNHLLLARAYDRLNRQQDVQAQVQAALRLEPNDPTANLAGAALLLRADDLPDANQQLERVAKLLTAHGKPSRNQMLDYVLFHGVLLALDGQTEAARQQLESVLASDAQNEGAQKALAALSP